MGTSGSWAVLDGQSTISQAEAVEDDAAEEEEREEIAQELKMFQPIYDDDGVVRFRKNEVVRFILDEGGLTLDDIASRDFSQADLEQFYQLIGYSVAGFHELDIQAWE